MSDPVDDFISRGFRYGDLAEKLILISPSALEAIKEQHPAHIDASADETSDGYFLGAMKPSTAVMVDRKIASRLEP